MILRIFNTVSTALSYTVSNETDNHEGQVRYLERWSHSLFQSIILAVTWTEW